MIERLFFIEPLNCNSFAEVDQYFSKI